MGRIVRRSSILVLKTNPEQPKLFTIIVGIVTSLVDDYA